MNGGLVQLLDSLFANASFGQRYNADGKQTGGWAVVGYPTHYGRSGVMTFLCSRKPANLPAQSLTYQRR